MKKLFIFLLVCAASLSAQAQWKLCDKCAVADGNPAACMKSGNSHVILARFTDGMFPSFIMMDETMNTEDADGAFYVTVTMDVTGDQIFEGVAYYDEEGCYVYTDIFYSFDKMWNNFKLAKMITITVYNTSEPNTVIVLNNRNGKDAYDFVMNKRANI